MTKCENICQDDEFYLPDHGYCLDYCYSEDYTYNESTKKCVNE